MKRLLTVVAVLAALLGGCQWAVWEESYNEHLPTRAVKQGPSHEEHRSQRTELWLYWQGEDGQWYREPAPERKVPHGAS